MQAYTRPSVCFHFVWTPSSSAAEMQLVSHLSSPSSKVTHLSAQNAREICCVTLRRPRRPTVWHRCRMWSWAQFLTFPAPAHILTAAWSTRPHSACRMFGGSTCGRLPNFAARSRGPGVLLGVDVRVRSTQFQAALPCSFVNSQLAERRQG
jgi:hypothetical protein